MENSTETSLRQSKTKVEIEGILASKKLEVITDKNGNKGIRGNLVIKVDDTNSISVKVYVGEKTSKGDINKAWEGINTVMNEYKSIAEVGEAEADRVYTKGDFETFRNQKNMDVVSYKSNYFNRVKGTFEPKRKFSAEVMIKSVYREIVNDEETGRLRVKGIAPGFNGTINILDMVCPVSIEGVPNFADMAETVFEVGSTFRVDGDVVNARVEKKVSAALGKLESDVEYKNELVITGSSEAYPEETAYNPATIELALTEYNTAQENRKNTANDDVPFDKKPTAEGSGRSLKF